MILAGCAGLFFAFITLGRDVRDSPPPIWVYLIYRSMFFTGPILIVAGGWLYSFKRAAWRLALVAHGIMLLHVMALNVLFCIAALSVTSDTDRFFSLGAIAAYLADWHGGSFVLAKGLLLLYGCSLSVLLVSRKMFKG